MRSFDLCIIGSGSGNSIPDERFADLSIAIVEQGRYGGTCLNVGCIPTKMMVRGSDLVAEVGRAATVAGEATISPAWSVVARRIDEEATTHWDDTIAVDRLTDAGATVHHGVARLRPAECGPP